MTDVVVIGGGVIGCSIAYHLSASGVRVALLERWQIAAGASGASAGGVRHQGRDVREFPLAFRAIERWRVLESELGADLSYRRNGHLTTIESEDDLEALQASVESQVAAGLDICVVEGSALRALAPSISPSVVAAAYTPNDGHANPAATTRAFADAAVRSGATISAGARVEGIEVEHGRIVGVRTTNGPIAANAVVLAAGAWSAELAREIGLVLPLEAQGFQAMTTKPAPHKLDQVLGSVRRMISLKQLPDGRYLLGGGWPGEFELNRPRGTTIASSQVSNRSEAIGIFPPVAAVEIEEAWLGIEAVAVDEVPIIGPVDGFDGLIVAAGFSGHGFALSPAVGEAVASLINSGKSVPELERLTLARFSNGETPTSQRAGTVG